jgi:hypothetical protein
MVRLSLPTTHDDPSHIAAKTITASRDGPMTRPQCLCYLTDVTALCVADQVYDSSNKARSWRRGTLTVFAARALNP